MTLPDPGVTTPPTDEQWKIDVGHAMQVLRFGVAYRQLDWDDQRDVLAVAEAIRDAEAAVHARYEQVALQLLEAARAVQGGVPKSLLLSSANAIREVAQK